MGFMDLVLDIFGLVFGVLVLHQNVCVNSWKSSRSRIRGTA